MGVCNRIGCDTEIPEREGFCDQCWGIAGCREFLVEGEERPPERAGVSPAVSFADEAANRAEERKGMPCPS